jgi:hypothetical protein
MEAGRHKNDCTRGQKNDCIGEQKNYCTKGQKNGGKSTGK